MNLFEYSLVEKEQWDEFVLNSKNGYFLFCRDYMDYHADRFEDASLMVSDDKGRLLAIFPANSKENSIYTHEGLTAGGLIVGNTMTLSTYLSIFDAVLSYFTERGFEQIYYKTVPHIYHISPAEEDRIALTACNAKLLKRSVLTVLKTNNRPGFQTRRLRGVKKARKNNLHVEESNNLTLYWNLLTELLWQRYQTKPVHSLEEIKLLHCRFKNNIKLYSCSQDQQMLGGVLIFQSQQVVRAQYIAASDLGKKLSALDLVFDRILNDASQQGLTVDFGSSDIGEKFVNASLLEQKEGFGARVIAHDSYFVDLKEWQYDACKGVMK